MKTTNKQSKEDTFFLYINTLILQIPPPEIEKTNRENWKKTREEKLVLKCKNHLQNMYKIFKAPLYMQ